MPLSPAYLATIKYPAQAVSIDALESKGFRFANWINAYDPEDETAQCAVMQRGRAGSVTSRQCQVEPDGSVDGLPLASYLASIKQ